MTNLAIATITAFLRKSMLECTNAMHECNPNSQATCVLTRTYMYNLVSHTFLNSHLQGFKTRASGPFWF